MFILGINGWDDKWNINNERYWISMQKTLKMEHAYQDTKRMHFTSKILFKTAMMIAVNDRLIWIDLLDSQFGIYVSDQYIHYGERAILLDTRDNNVSIMNLMAQTWYKIKISDILPKLLYWKWRIRMDFVVERFIINKGIKRVPNDLMRLISSFVPVLFYVKN